ncbi:phosphate acetyltransferase [Candidatus Woesearchaeota archaeon]|nr:phosphate acetyltransferase [Candidatus Woesearchaeota archaeon]
MKHGTKQLVNEIRAKTFMDDLKKKAQKDKKRIVFPEGEEERILKACEVIVKEEIATPYLIGDAAKIHEKASKLGVSLDGVEIRDPFHDHSFEAYVKKFFEMRKHKGIDLEKAKEIVRSPIYFGTMMVHLGDADGLIAGSTTSTADTLRPALQIIKTHEKFHKVSSVFLMILGDRILIFADSAVMIEPDAKDLAAIAIDTSVTAKKFGIEPRIAMLSFSTNSSAKHPLVDKVKEATAIVKDKAPDLVVEGEMQVDAAIVPVVCEKKFPDSKLKGDANVLIFPDLNSGNIAYKLVERLAKAQAVGPILQGLKKPVNDLSRGCSVDDIIDVCAITVVEAQR